MKLVGFGLGLGLFCALLLGRAMRSLLYGLDSADALSLAGCVADARPGGRDRQLPARPASEPYRSGESRCVKAEKSYL